MNLTKLYIVEDFAEDLNIFSLPDADGFSGYEDYSGYNCIDGEEGDHGKIKYYDSNMKLMATKVDYGGDSYEWFWEDDFKTFALDVIFDQIRNRARDL